MRVLVGIILLGLCGTMTASAEEKKEEKASGAKATPYVHVVVFPIKKDAPAGTADKLLADCHELLAKIPSVRELRAGRPAEKSTGVAKKNYQVGLVVFFDDYDGLKAYIDHKLHTEFVGKYKEYIDDDGFGVYDFLNAKK